MLGKTVIDLLADQAKSAGKATAKAVPRGYHGAPLPKPKTGYHGAPLPKPGTPMPSPARARPARGYHGAPAPKRPVGGYRGGSMPGKSSSYNPNNPPPPGYGPPPKQPGFFARHGKKTAAAVAGGAMVGGAIKNRTGKAVDPTTGLPKGMYGY